MPRRGGRKWGSSVVCSNGGHQGREWPAEKPPRLGQPVNFVSCDKQC